MYRIGSVSSTYNIKIKMAAVCVFTSFVSDTVWACVKVSEIIQPLVSDYFIHDFWVVAQEGFYCIAPAMGIIIHVAVL